MKACELLGKSLSFTRLFSQNLPAVIGGAQPAEKSPFHEPVGELHGAVMLELHSLRQDADRRFESFRQSLDGHQKLVLLRFNARLSRRGLAETQKATYLIAKFRHCSKVGPNTHFIISLYDSIAIRYVFGFVN